MSNSSPHKERLVVEAIRHGTVVDHIPADRTLMAVEILIDPDSTVFIGVNLASSSLGRKGIIKIQDKVLNDEEIRILSALAPGATVNVIADYSIVRKFKLEVPARVDGLFVCGNNNCITNHEPLTTRFKLSGTEYACQYCERPFSLEKLQIRPMPR